jgi:hypothetical protein
MCGILVLRQLLSWGFRCEPRTVRAVRCAWRICKWAELYGSGAGSVNGDRGNMRVVRPDKLGACP